LVGRRFFSTLVALRISSTRRSSASARFCFLRTVLLGLDDQHAVAGDPTVTQRQQPLLVELGQGRIRNVEAQMHRARHLVDVLPPGALRTNGRQLDLGIRQMHIVGNHQHGKASVFRCAQDTAKPIPGLTKIQCRSEPARDCGASDKKRLTDTQQSRAGSLLQWISVEPQNNKPGTLAGFVVYAVALTSKAPPPATRAEHCACS
jgi:hypothetical protein